MSVGFAKKIGMTRLFVNGKAVSVTVIQFEKQFVLQQKTQKKDGYVSIQVGGFMTRKVTRPLGGHIAKYMKKNVGFRCLSEFKNVDLADNKVSFDISDFAKEDLIDISGTVKGRGFAGPIKKYGFRGQPASHGHDHVRGVGSIGSRWPQRTLPGTRMAGRMGGNTVTLKKTKVLEIDSEQNLMFVNGSIPGPNGGFLKIKKNN